MYFCIGAKRTAGKEPVGHPGGRQEGGGQSKPGHKGLWGRRTGKESGFRYVRNTIF